MEHEERKFMLCQYPRQGFGSKAGGYYLLDKYGYTYDITDEYDKEIDETYKAVTIRVASPVWGKDLDELLAHVEFITGSKIERW